MPLPARGIAGRGQRPTRAPRAPEDAAIRRSVVASARARLASGYYDLPQVRGRIAEAVLREIQD